MDREEEYLNAMLLLLCDGMKNKGRVYRCSWGTQFPRIGVGCP